MRYYVGGHRIQNVQGHTRIDGNNIGRTGIANNAHGWRAAAEEDPQLGGNIAGQDRVPWHILSWMIQRRLDIDIHNTQAFATCVMYLPELVQVRSTDVHLSGGAKMDGYRMLRRVQQGTYDGRYCVSLYVCSAAAHSVSLLAKVTGYTRTLVAECMRAHFGRKGAFAVKER